MAKKVDTYLKLQVPAGEANPSPPVGPALGQAGINIMEFCKAFNAETQSVEKGMRQGNILLCRTHGKVASPARAPCRRAWTHTCPPHS